MEMFRRTYAEVNLEHLSHNFNLIQKIAQSDRFLCPMVKANAYGHGDVRVAQHLVKIGAKNLGVCLIEEGLLLRKSGIQADILVFRGFDKQGAQKIYDARLIPVISTWEHIRHLEQVADEPISVHLKFNTGMNRLGFDVIEADKLKNFFRNSKKFRVKGLLSHLFNGDDAINPTGDSAKQGLQMLDIYKIFDDQSIKMHLLNSGGIASLASESVRKNKQHFLNQHDWGFRPGLMLYGYAPSDQFDNLDLKPVMTFKSVVDNIRSVFKGDIVSYGASWIATRDSRIAIVPVGYADGLHRMVSNKGQALFAGHVVPIIGKVCMDFIMLDVTDVVKPNEVYKYDEEEVILFGYDQNNNFHSAKKTAESSQTIVWEILTSVGDRVPRHYKGATIG